MANKFRLIIVSGRSGSGKSTALHVLEDEGFYCIDNLPASLLTELINRYTKENCKPVQLAVGIDARNTVDELKEFPADFAKIRQNKKVESDIIFLDADVDSLLKRFSMTQRKHPLSQKDESLEDTISKEFLRLRPLFKQADIKIDTSQLSVHELSRLVRERVIGQRQSKLNLLLQSFGFKYGIPSNADFIFDVRCLPNPYWIEDLREYTGKDEPVINFLKNNEHVMQMKQDIANFLQKWIPFFRDSTRSYITIAIGCTGGKHRSVFLCESLGKMFYNHDLQVIVQHREE